MDAAPTSTALAASNPRHTMRKALVVVFLPLASAVTQRDDTVLAPTSLSVASLAYVSQFTILSTHPHCSASPCTAFTEGLAFDAAGNLYESMGGYDGDVLRGLRQMDVATGGSIGSQIEPADGQFVEGLTVLPDGRMLQLTYREGQVNEYHTSPALERVSTVSASLGAEGWGLTRSADGAVLYLTDSTEELFHVNASSLEVMRQVPVVDERLNQTVYGVNELELVGDEVWGNVYPTCASSSGSRRRVLCDHSECVVRIDPATGRVRGWIDFSALLEHETEAVRADLSGNGVGNSVLNGIAYHATSDRLLVTGKNWQSVYRVALRPTELGTEHVASTCRLAPR